MAFSGNVLKITFANGTSPEINTPVFGATQDSIWVTLDVMWPSSTQTFALDATNGGTPNFMFPRLADGSQSAHRLDLMTPDNVNVFYGDNFSQLGSFNPVAGTVYTVELHVDQSGGGVWAWYVNSSLIASGTGSEGQKYGQVGLGFNTAFTGWDVPSNLIMYLDNFKVGTTRGASDLWSDDFTSGSISSYIETADTSHFSFVDAASITSLTTASRVLIAFNDGPLVASPTWTAIDATPNLVAAIDISVGRQTLVSQTNTGTATVYLNDTTGLFDPRNGLSPYFGKLDGRQIQIQLWDPVTDAWYSQFRGLIDDYGYVIHPASDKDGNPILANVQIDCVDIFDYLAGYGLTPGLDGVTAPSGSEGTVYYAATVGTVDGRITEVLTDVGIDSTRYVVFTGNVSLQESKYDADESALVVLRDCADAEIPFIANIYVDRQGRFCFHGRESRFTPDTVAAGAGTAAWDFQRWKVGDGAAVKADSTRAQIRVLEYSRARSNVINAALCYPKGIAEADIPGQAYADSTSITAYGKHTPPGGPITDLQINEGTTTGNSGKVECQKYAELLVKNQKDPREAITTIQLKSMSPSDVRATATWAMLTRADISDVVNVKAGYGGGTGMTGASTVDDYYIEGRTMRIEPATAIEAGGFDYVELNLDLSPAVWSMDTHGVF